MGTHLYKDNAYQGIIASPPIIYTHVYMNNSTTSIVASSQSAVSFLSSVQIHPLSI